MTRPLHLTLTMSAERTDLQDAEDWVEHCAAGWRLWLAQSVDLELAASLSDADLAHAAPEFAPAIRRRMGDRKAMCEREADLFLNKWRHAAKALLGMQISALREAEEFVAGMTEPVLDTMGNDDLLAARSRALMKLRADLADVERCVPTAEA